MKITSILFLLSLSIFQAGAQGILSIDEIPPSGEASIHLKNRQAIDINSRLDMKIREDSLYRKISSISRDSVREIIRELQLYKDYVGLIQQNISAYEDALQVFNDSSKTDKETSREQLYNAIRSRANIGLKSIDLIRSHERMYRKWTERLSSTGNKSTSERYRLISAILLEEIPFMEARLKSSGVFIQMAAWIIRDGSVHQLHLEGFDSLAQGSYYQYQRNQLFITPEQKKEIQDLVQFFEQTDRSGMLQQVRNLSYTALLNVADLPGIEKKLKLLLAQIQQIETESTNLKVAWTKDILKIKAGIDALQDTLIFLQGKYSATAGINGSKLEVLDGFLDDVNGIAANIDRIKTEISLLLQLPGLDKMIKQLREFEKEVDGLIATIGATRKNLVPNLKDMYQAALMGKEINTAALHISKRTYELSLARIPAAAALDLNFSGERKPGDQLVIRLMYNQSGNPSPIELERMELNLINALPHLHMTVAYAFARPVARDAHFKGGPAYAVLYKFKSHSLAYRNFLDFGIGLHVATFDFNNDDTPEFAGGMILSLFRDYLQGGWGFNFNANTGYWYAGLRIPFPQASIPVK